MTERDRVIAELRKAVASMPEEPKMLVLSRKVGEKLVIGDNITVVVSRIAGNRVTLAVEAPHDVRIVRGELKLHDNTPKEAALPRTGADEAATEKQGLSLRRLAK